MRKYIFLCMAVCLTSLLSFIVGYFAGIKSEKEADKAVAVYSL